MKFGGLTVESILNLRSRIVSISMHSESISLKSVSLIYLVLTVTMLQFEF
jgi:hypothetical protein